MTTKTAYRLTKEEAHEVYDVLSKHGKASERDRNKFVEEVARGKDEIIVNFQGKHEVCVDLQEDMWFVFTSEHSSPRALKRSMDIVNELLEITHMKFY